MPILFFLVTFTPAFAQQPPTPKIKARTSYNPAKPLYSVILELQTPSLPRKDLGDAVIKNEGVRSCLRSDLVSAGDDFSVHILGHVDRSGQLSDANVSTFRSQDLAQCVQDAVNAVKLKAPGKAGDFDISIEKQKVTGRPAKTYTLDLNEP